MLKKFYSSVAGAPTKTQICIVGSGPAGYYCAQQLIKLLPSVIVDIFEKLPVPFGLVRYGVAPDHPEVKNVINTFTKTGSDPRVHFYGNICLGKDIFLKDLKDAYHAVALCYGAENDRKLNIIGENERNIISARKFVGWYNGLPDDKNLDVDLTCDEAVILGQGNVAMDVARILLTSIDQLKKTDITEYSLDQLASSRIKRVKLIGRRGPLQVAFTIKEFREMLKLPNVQTAFRNEQLTNVSESLNSLARPRKRLSELILKSSTEQKSQCSKHFEPIFLRSPQEFLIEDNIVQGIKFAVNVLEGPADNQRAIATGEEEIISCGIAFRSIGYQSLCVDPNIPFNEKTCTVIPSEGVYSAGWLNTGPFGVILSTMSNAFEVGQRISHDIESGQVLVSHRKPGATHVLNLLKQKGIPIVTWEGWKKIDQEEIRRGALKEKPREKIVSVEEMIDISGNS